MACSLVTEGYNLPSKMKPARFNIEVNVTQVVFTPLACASVINELIKTLVFQKSQIPYPYSWLKALMEKKKRSLEQKEEQQPFNLSAARYYRLASAAYYTLEEIMRNIREEFQNRSSQVHEVLIVFGTTPQCPKQAFTIKVPSIARGHIEENHLQTLSRNQHKILQDILLSETWQSATDSMVNTNMYVMLRKTDNSNSSGMESFFLPSTEYNLPSRVKNIVITLNYDSHDSVNCCNSLSIFQDDLHSNEVKYSNDGDDSRGADDSSANDAQWYQAKELVTGFKDCYVNKVSVSELW